MKNTKTTPPKKDLLTPSRLRILLTISLFLIAIAMAGAFSVAQNILRTEAQTVSDASLAAQNSANLVQTLSATKQKLADNKDAIERASSIVAQSKEYQYQNQIVTDITRFARDSGVTIITIDFPAAPIGTASAVPTPTPAAPGTTPAPAAPAGVKSITATITVKNPVNYDSLLNFVNAIQNNLTNMQVSSLSVAAAEGGVSTQSLTLQVYVR